ncbi:MAG: hypothetical protein K2X93_00090 [Candidatus Obscuribacterales bacterium]|nr:hypothetical protein [Candidatus Obscuribacterales bacterium]
MTGGAIAKVEQLELAPINNQYRAQQMQIASIEQAQNVSQMIIAATTKTHPKHKEALNTILILAGMEMGMSPIRATQELFIDPRSGKVGQYVSALRNEIARDPRYDYRVIETSDKVAVVQFYELIDGKMVACNKGEPIIRTREWAEKEGKFSKPVWEDGKMVSGNVNYQKWIGHPQNMLLWQAIRDGAKFFCKGLFNGAPIMDDVEIAEINDQAENNYPVANVAQVIAEANGHEEPTKEDVLEAAIEVGDTEIAKQVQQQIELQYIGDGQIKEMRAAGAARKWSSAQIIGWCKESFKGQEGFDEKKPLHITFDQYNKAKEHFANNDPAATGG